MPAATDRLEFTPPPQPGAVRAFTLAILAHVLLMLALTWGISWNRESENSVAEAELWSSIPQQAAPRAATAPPVVQAPPMPVPVPPPPPPAEKVEPAPPAPLPQPPDIALEQEKRKQEQALLKQQEIDRQKKIEARKKQQELQQRQLAEQKAAEEKKRQDEQVKAAKAKARQQEEAKQLEALRQDNLKHMQGLANATGRDDSTGAARHAAGPSADYGSRIQARVRPHIVFTDDVSGNPKAEVEVRMAPDGTIVGRKLVKSSGVKSWDDAVLRALDKTESLPRDTDGRVHTPLIIEFKLKG